MHEPSIWGRLHGDLEGVFSYHFRKNRVDYRAAYTIEEAEKIVYILMIGKRESFYEVLKRRLS
ncbi:MAG: type II toxin-antitoxin system RelE/ParE family toxin [Desulfobacterales bacterium]|nr:type II toxin-antitoxin system RelE/ParE family toxin [Desulfobacterales bacterium]